MEKALPNIHFAHREIEVSTITLTIPTYRLGPQDPNPPLFGKGIRAIYPYPWQKSFTTDIEEKSYDAMVLKSRWMELTILPDWGMHLYRAVDRQTGRDLFHCPKVMKPAHNAIRGAYVAGGVEFNFPVGHTAATYSRVGLHVKKTEEGVQALFHHIDRRSGMILAAGVTLFPDYRGILFDQYMHNPTALPQPWYYWLNAGLVPHPSLRFCFLTDTMLGHFEGSFLETVTRYSYPIHEGFDYSKYPEIPEPIGLFSPGGLSGWFGAWYDDWKFGVVRWTPPWQVAGQKFWSWGTSGEGRLWGPVAADQELPVPEIQSGRPETQMDRGILRPFDALSHREWWMPVSNLDDLHAASRFGAMAIKDEGRQTAVAISPAETLKGCRVRLNAGLLEETFDLEIGKPFKTTVPMPRNAIHALAIQGPHGTILSWSREKTPVAANVEALYDHPQPVDQMSAESLFLRGFRYERTQRNDLARKFYHWALKKDPEFSRVHLHLGLMDLVAENPDNALKECSLALERDRGNEEALYLHGLASLWKGDVRQARADFCRAAATGTDYVVPAVIQLASDALREKEYDQARMLIDQGLQSAPANGALLFLHACDCRIRGDMGGLRQTLEELDHRLGVSLMTRWERSFAHLDEETYYIPAEEETEDEYRIAAALEYSELGLTNEAFEVLKKVTSEIGLAKVSYLVRRIGRDIPGAKKIKFFAWGRPIRLALEASLRSDPNDFVACFALGCLRAELGHLDKAVAHVQQAATLVPDDPVIGTALGTVYLEAGDTDRAVEELRRTLALMPSNPKAWVVLDTALKLQDQRNAEWLACFSAAPGDVLENEEARETLARLYADLGHYDSAAHLLETRTFHPYELTHDLRNLWSRIHREKAIHQALSREFDSARKTIQKALEYPLNLQLGRPYRRFDAGTLFSAGCILEMQGDRTGARTYFAQAADEDQPDPTPAKPWSVLALIKRGDKIEAGSRLARLRNEARRYRDAAFQPDLEDALEKIIALCDRIESGWIPTLEELREELR